MKKKSKILNNNVKFALLAKSSARVKGEIVQLIEKNKKTEAKEKLTSLISELEKYVDLDETKLIEKL